MDIVDQPTGIPPHRTAGDRPARRNALDASIRRELNRGEAIGVGLHVSLRELLTALVEHELQRSTPMTEESLQAVTPIFGLLRRTRFQRHLEHAIRLGLVRRERLILRPTVAGVAAVRSTSAPGYLRAEQEKLRELRDAEIGTI